MSHVAEHINKIIKQTGGVFNIMVYQCFKYLYIRNCLIEMKGAAVTVEMEEVLPVMVEYVSRFYCRSSSLAVIKVNYQLPPRSCSTIMIHHHGHNASPLSGSTITISDSRPTIINYGPASWSTTWPQLDLQTIKHKDSGEEVKSVTCINETLMCLMS